MMVIYFHMESHLNIFQSYTEFDRDDHEDGEEETDPLQPRKAQQQNFPFYFFDSE